MKDFHHCAPPRDSTPLTLSHQASGWSPGDAFHLQTKITLTSKFATFFFHAPHRHRIQSPRTSTIHAVHIRSLLYLLRLASFGDTFVSLVLFMLSRPSYSPESRFTPVQQYFNLTIATRKSLRSLYSPTHLALRKSYILLYTQPSVNLFQTSPCLDSLWQFRITFLLPTRTRSHSHTLVHSSHRLHIPD